MHRLREPPSLLAANKKATMKEGWLNEFTGKERRKGGREGERERERERGGDPATKPTMSEKNKFSTLGCLKSDTSRLNYFSILSESLALNRKKMFLG